ncbi:MAG TPA: hypothetical protein VKY73_11620 [Polyangiaceae bacterium]|nr:hypothetical protein [Polyangiaceae bacterium]
MGGLLFTTRLPLVRRLCFGRVSPFGTRGLVCALPPRLAVRLDVRELRFVFVVGASLPVRGESRVDRGDVHVVGLHVVSVVGTSLPVVEERRHGNQTEVNIRELHLVIVGVAKLAIDRRPGDPADQLRVTRDHFDDLGSNLHIRPGPVLDSSLTPLANGHGDLVRRAPRVGGSLQDLARQLEEKRVVIHRLGRPTPNHGRRFSKRGVRLRAHVEAKNVPTRFRPPWIRGTISTRSTPRRPRARFGGWSRLSSRRA